MSDDSAQAESKEERHPDTSSEEGSEKAAAPAAAAAAAAVVEEASESSSGESEDEHETTPDVPAATPVAASASPESESAKGDKKKKKKKGKKDKKKGKKDKKKEDVEWIEWPALFWTGRVHEEVAVMAAEPVLASEAAERPRADSDDGAGDADDAAALERAVKRFLRGLKSDFGTQRALDAFARLLADPARAERVLALAAVADSADLVAQLVHMLDVLLAPLAVLRVVEHLTLRAPFAAALVAAAGVAPLARAMADRDALLDADGRETPGGALAAAVRGLGALAHIAAVPAARAPLAAALDPAAVAALAAQFAADAHVQAYAAAVLGTCALAAPAPLRAATAAALGAQLAAALAAHAADARTAAALLWALRALVARAKAAKAVAAGPAAPAAAAAAAAVLRAHPKSAELAGHACALLAVLLAHPAAAAPATDADVPGALAAAVAAHATCTDVCVPAGGALRAAARHRRLREGMAAGAHTVVPTLLGALRGGSDDDAGGLLDEGAAVDLLDTLAVLAAVPGFAAAAGGVDALRDFDAAVAARYRDSTRVADARSRFMAALKQSGSCTLL